jgi:RNA polymerase sigma-70 factor, ECF subfamily
LKPLCEPIRNIIYRIVGGGTNMDEMIRDRIKQVKRGDQSAFEDVVSFFQNKIYQHCFRMLGNAHEAEDIAQEAFIRAYVNIHSFDDRRKFSTWLYRIATNLTIDRLRKRKPDHYLDAEVKGTEGLDMYSQLADQGRLPEEEVEGLELQRYIQYEISKLPPKYRSIIMLRYIEEFSLQEISEILDIPLGTVKTRIHRGREALRKKLRHV